MFITPISNAFRSYEVHTQWVALDQAKQARAVGPVRSKQPGLPIMPELTYKHDHFAKQTAQELSGVIDKGEQLKQAAQAAAKRTPTDDAQLAETAEQVVQSYNKLASALSEAGPLLRPAAKKLGAKLSDETLRDIGIERQQDGTLQVDQQRLREAVSDSPEQAKELLQGPNGLLAQLVDAAESFSSSSAASLIDTSHAAYRSHTNYTASAVYGLQTYLASPMRGTLLDVLM
ncbi:flagellar filament capping protein FliD [Paenibacillus sp. YYML68]|uniref:flagellar filament capping protein FliD n=1 Tax=Paenibacillus sp. YYML68 TaxID=2909250 RepID=UPI002492AD82|nr:flagellar filament capping protein FliD [Paenibacillus sp. YYML68]